jgi:hypothetical protein
LIRKSILTRQKMSGTSDKNQLVREVMISWVTWTDCGGGEGFSSISVGVVGAGLKQSSMLIFFKKLNPFKVLLVKF